MEYLKLALMFYYTLNDKDGDFLDKNDFSKSEILTDFVMYQESTGMRAWQRQCLVTVTSD